MHVKPHPVSQTVVERLAVAGIGDEAAGDRIDIAHAFPGADRSDRSLLRLQHDAIHFANLPRDATDEHHAGQIAGIAAHAGTPIKQDRATFFHLTPTGMGVRQRTVETFCADRRESHSRRAATLHLVFQPGCHFLLGLADPNARSHGHKRVLGNANGLADRRQFGWVLGQPHVGHDRRSVNDSNSLVILLDLSRGAEGH